MSKTFKHQMTKIRNSQTGEFESMPTLKGADGITPHIGTNGNWWIGNIDTGVNSHGEKGDAGVTPHIGENGHWYIGDTDTGVTAQGKDYVLTDNDKTEIASMVEVVENPYDDSAVKKDISDLKAGKVDKSDYSPDDKTSDMTQPVGKDGNGKLWTKSSGEGTSITEQDVANWGFTKNEGTYVKPADGIPASDLADGVIPDVSIKIDKPQNSPVVGKILKVLSVNDDGTFTCEWADAPNGGVSDIRMNADTVDKGSVLYNGNLLLNKKSFESVKDDKGQTIVQLSRFDVSGMQYRNEIDACRYQAVIVNKFGTFLKAAMSDGVDPAWTATEQESARERMGIHTVTQAEYDALTDTSGIYIIVEE